MTKGMNVEALMAEEESLIKGIVVALRRLGVTVVAIEEDLQSATTVSSLALGYFAKARISLITPLSRQSLKCISDDLGGAFMFSDPDQIKAKDATDKCITLSSINQQRIGSETLLFIQLASNAPSIILRGSTSIELEETKRALHDALCVLRNLVRSPSIVPGGGACEIESSIQIQAQANNLNTIESIPMISFAEKYQRYYV
eukprot:gene3839-4431_t